MDQLHVESLQALRRNGSPRKYCSCLVKGHKQRSNNNKMERVVSKCGEFNLEKCNVSKYRVFPDIVRAFVRARWRWTLIYSFFTYITIWLIFAVIWWIILYIHGDLEPENLPNSTNSTWTPCIREIYSFTSIFLFSIEIHTSIGYGTRSLTLACPEAMVIMCVESILGTIIQSFIVGIIFAKLTRPKNRAHTLMFSKNAVVNQKDRKLCLMFRVGDTRKSRILAVNVRAFLIRSGSRMGNLNNDQIQLDLSLDSSGHIFFMFPILVVHVIDENSPLFSVSAGALLKSDLEFVVVFEGTIESTGQTVQARSSYTSSEILWGYRFVQLVEYQTQRDRLVIDYSKFDKIYCVNTPLCSADSLHSFYKVYLERKKRRRAKTE